MLAVAVATALTGCTDSPEPAPTATASLTPTAEAAPTAEAPTLVPEGDASANLPYFSQIVQSVAAGPDTGRAYVDALVAGGFDKGAMQVTENQSTVGNAAESMQFSVRWGDECLIGQVGPSTGQPVAVVMPGLAAGRCLVGNTRPIDW